MRKTIIFTLEQEDKEKLQELADNLKISLADFCRMTLLSKNNLLIVGEKN